MSADVKTCTRCQQAQPLEDYPRDRTKRDGRASHCKECRSAQSARHRAANTDRKRAYDREHYAANRDRIRERKREDYAKNRDAYIARATAWREANPGTRSSSPEYAREYRQRNLEAQRARERAYDESHREERRAYHRENPHRAWEHEYRRRARAAGYPVVLERFTRDDLMAHLGITAWACLECGITDGVELDHIVPVQFGGPHTLDNCRPLCGSHNREAWRQARAAQQAV